MSETRELGANERIDEAMSHLDGLEQLPVDQHAQIFDDIHAVLRSELSQAGREAEPRQP